MKTWLVLAFAAPLAVGLAAGRADAVVYCKAVGVPKGCVARPGAVGVGAAGIGVRPGLGAGAAGVGLAPGAGVGANLGGPVNRVGVR